MLEYNPEFLMNRHTFAAIFCLLFHGGIAVFMGSLAWEAFSAKNMGAGFVAACICYWLLASAVFGALFILHCGDKAKKEQTAAS